MKAVKKALITLIDEKGVVLRTRFMEGEDFFITVDPEMCKILSKALDIKSDGKEPKVITEEECNEYCKLKLRYFQENLFKCEGGTPVDWACFNITRYLHDYLKEHNVKDTDSITEKRMQAVAFAHCLEDKLLDYIDKLEEFNS